MIKATLKFIGTWVFIALAIVAYYAYLVGALGPWLALLGE